MVTPKIQNDTEKVLCGIPGCKAKSMLDLYLKSHMLNVHKTKIWTTRGQTDLQSFFVKDSNSQPMKSPKSTDSVPDLIASDSDDSDEHDPATITNNEMDTHDLVDIENNNLSDVISFISE